MKLIKKLAYYCLIAFLVIILPDSIKGLALIVVVIVWICSFFISAEEKERRRQEELRREKDNQNAERMRMYREIWWWHGDDKTIDAIKMEAEQGKYIIIMTDERTDTVKTYDEYLEELTSDDSWNIQQSYDEWVEGWAPANNTPEDSTIHYIEAKEPVVRRIEDPYEDYNSSVGVSDGYSEDDDRGPDAIEEDEEWEKSKASSLDLDDESKNEHWSMYDEDIRTELDPAYELKQREYRKELRNYRGYDTNFSVGDTIEHHKFWRWIILSMEADVAAIKFNDWGIKKLNHRVAPIRKSINL